MKTHKLVVKISSLDLEKAKSLQHFLIILLGNLGLGDRTIIEVKKGKKNG